MAQRTAIVRKGLKYQKKPQTRVGGSWLPKYPMAAASRETAFRHVWHRRGGRRDDFFEIQFVRDDGVVIDEDLMDTLEIYSDDPDISTGGVPRSTPILYLYNYRDYYEYFTPEEETKFEDQFYNLDKNGIRKNNVYNPDTGYWQFDGYRRPLSEIWGDTETDDLTKPTSPPSIRKCSKKWNGSEYVAQKTKGYYIRVIYTDGLRSVFRVLAPEEKEVGQLSRGYIHRDSEGNVYWETKYMVAENLVKPGKFKFQIPYYKYSDGSSYPSEGYVHYDDIDDIDQGLPYISAQELAGVYFFSIDTSFWRRRKIKSSVPYVLVDIIEIMGNLSLGQAPPYSTSPGGITTTISGLGASLVYTSNTGLTEKQEGETEFPRTFDPVNTAIPFSPISEEAYNEQTYQIGMTITAGSHKVSVGREFTYHFRNYTQQLDENA